jgi:hypothetical protein
MSATSAGLTAASAALVCAARQAKTALAAYKTAARQPRAGWDERACALGRLQLAAQQLASCVNYGGYAASGTMTAVPGTDAGWIKATTYAAACEVQLGANRLRDWRGLQRGEARPVKNLRVLHAAGEALEELYDLLVRQHGTSRLRPGDAPEFTELLGGGCAELAAALCAEAKHTRPVLGDGPAADLVYAGAQARQGRALLSPVIRNITADIAALPPRGRMRTKAKAL